MDERARRVFRTFMVGSAVAASLSALEAANNPVLAATGLTATPGNYVMGESPAVTLNWTAALSPVTTVTVNIGAFTTNAASNCVSSGISVRMGGTSLGPIACTWNSVANTFTLATSSSGANNLTFPAGLLKAGMQGSTPMTLIDDGLVATASQTISFTPGAGSLPPEWFQSYQRDSSTDLCANPWSPSWAMWANRGSGGFVCVRTNYYDPNLASWLYR
ncbi:unannotated protein [freshwater metagenome]|uniref:Unannotated protein n=1 Tax=freshwater metagenome TaxID=449393 RepID=A0A6J6M2M2_9ZZZZ|nr:hypothetical protein [Actinomycetota bacterium]